MSDPTVSSVIEVRNLTMAYGDRVIMENLNFSVGSGEVFIIMGGSGCGKSTLLKHLIGLMEPRQGTVHLMGEPFTAADPDQRARSRRKFGVLYQTGALWSSMTVGENVALPLQTFTNLSAREIQDIVRYKLSLVAMQDFADYYPESLSGGMRKRAGIARALALDPAILFLDEPSAGLDPISSQRLDKLIISLRQVLGATVVVVTHELSSIFTIADRSLFLDAAARTMTALGSPHELLRNPPNPNIKQFLSRNV